MSPKSKVAKTDVNSTPSSMFKFIHKSSNDNDITFKLDTSAKKETVIGKGPEIRAMLGPLLNHYGKDPSYAIFPYECVQPGSKGYVEKYDNGTPEIVYLPSTIGMSGEKWNERDEHLEQPFKLRVPKQIGISKFKHGKTVLNPGTGIVLCNTSCAVYTKTDKSGNPIVNSYYSMAFMRKDEYFDFSNLLTDVSTHPFDLEQNLKENISVVVVPESQASSMVENVDKFQIGVLSNVSYNQGEIGYDGENR
jgi:hypothetical protein